MSEKLGVLFLVLFVVAAAVCIYLSMTMSRRVQAGITRWRDEEKQTLVTELKQLADADARLQSERWRQEHEQQIRMDAIQRSMAITKGKVTEHIVPYLPGFDLDPKDIRFLGTPIDLIAFKGLNASVEVEIVFIEVKTGGSVLSAREKAVKKAVEEKKVSWRVFNPDVNVDKVTRGRSPAVIDAAKPAGCRSFGGGRLLGAPAHSSRVQNPNRAGEASTTYAILPCCVMA